MPSVSFSDVPATKLGPEPDRSRIISGFWRRLFAFLIDCLILAIIGWLSGFFLFDFYVHLGGWGRLLGFSIALLYFGLLNSSMGKGQTLGKRTMQIEVVNRWGDHISLGRSLLRFAILGIPWFFTFPLVYYSNLTMKLIGFLTTGLGVAIIYLFLFNRRTRQSVHDLATDTLVVRTLPKGSPSAVYLWKPHLVIAGTLYLGLVVLFISLIQFLQPELAPLQEVAKQIEASGKYRVAAYNIQTYWVKKEGKRYTSRGLKLIIMNDSRFPGFEFAATPAREIAALVLKKYPDVMKKDRLIISFCQGYDIGIASYWRHQYVSYSPRQWQKFVNHPEQMIKEIRHQRQPKGT